MLRIVLESNSSQNRIGLCLKIPTPTLQACKESKNYLQLLIARHNNHAIWSTCVATMGSVHAQQAYFLTHRSRTVLTPKDFIWWRWDEFKPLSPDWVLLKSVWSPASGCSFVRTPGVPPRCTASFPPPSPSAQSNWTRPEASPESHQVRLSPEHTGEGIQHP